MRLRQVKCIHKERSEIAHKYTQEEVNKRGVPQQPQQQLHSLCKLSGPTHFTLALPKSPATPDPQSEDKQAE